MLMAPTPICFSIIISKAGKGAISTMVFSRPHAIGPILVMIPFVIVVVASVVIPIPVIFGSQGCGSYDRRYDQSRSQQARLPKTVR